MVSASEASFIDLGSSRLLLDFAYRAKCPRCGAVALYQNDKVRHSLVCRKCNLVTPPESYARRGYRQACEDCGLIAVLWVCAEALLCAGCARKWDEGGRPSLEHLQTRHGVLAYVPDERTLSIIPGWDPTERACWESPPDKANG